jgi:hypothetical protein
MLLVAPSVLKICSIFCVPQRICVKAAINLEPERQKHKRRLLTLLRQRVDSQRSTLELMVESGVEMAPKNVVFSD